MYDLINSFLESPSILRPAVENPWQGGPPATRSISPLSDFKLSLLFLITYQIIITDFHNLI